MKTFEILLEGGLKRNWEADRYEVDRGDLVFYEGEKMIASLTANKVLMIEEGNEEEAQGFDRASGNPLNQYSSIPQLTSFILKFGCRFAIDGEKTDVALAY